MKQITRKISNLKKQIKTGFYFIFGRWIGRVQINTVFDRGGMGSWQNEYRSLSE